MNINTKQLKKTLKKSRFELTLVAVVLAAAMYTGVPAMAAHVDAAIQDAEWKTEMAVKDIQNNAMPYGTLPESGRAEPRYLTTMTVTAYNSVPGQTDATPCIGAQGTDICVLYNQGENICAANFVPLGTKLMVDGLGECTVRDRMNARYFYRVDWYMGMDVTGARQFGARQKSVSVYPSI